MSSFKLKPIAIALLTTILIVACQNKAVRQPNNSQLADCRTVEHLMGEVCIPQRPQRLVNLDQITLADTLALGVPSIGVATDFGGEVPSYLEKQNNNLMLLGKSDQPNLERMLKLDPDLIVGTDTFGEPIFERLSQIAPTALGKWVGFPSWREHFDFVARILGKEDKAKEVWESYYQHIAEIKVSLGEQLEKKMAFIYVHNGTVNVGLKNSFAGGIFADLGIRQPENYAKVDWGSIPLSEEKMPEIDADILFICSYGEESQQKRLIELQQKPLWQKLKAVQAGEAYIVDSNIWMGGDPIAANIVLDDLYKYLVKSLSIDF